MQPIRELLRVWGMIEGHETPARIVGLSGGDRYEIRRGLVVHAFDVNHRVPALGFGVVDVRHKLKPEYAGLSGPELVALKKKAVEIEHKVEVPLVTFCGDTAEGAWQNLEIVRKARVLILECSFFEADHVRRARAGYHLHVRDVARILGEMECEHYVITHLSRRTSLREAKASLTKLVAPQVAERITFLMDRRKNAPPHFDNRKPEAVHPIPPK